MKCFCLGHSLKEVVRPPKLELFPQNLIEQVSTTEKDFERLPVAWRKDVQTLPIEIAFDPSDVLDGLLSRVIPASKHER